LTRGTSKVDVSYLGLAERLCGLLKDETVTETGGLQ
jgi:hypothetical protein